jgi:hypothetical protein
MSTYATGANRKPGICRDCGEHLANGEGSAFEVWDYPWDGSDTEGSVTQLMDSYMVCADVTECARRVVTQGTNVQALKRIARDHENLGELANQAKAILHDYAELSRQQAITADLVAREQGYGAIGGYHG